MKHMEPMVELEGLTSSARRNQTWPYEDYDILYILRQITRIQRQFLVVITCANIGNFFFLFDLSGLHNS